MKVCYKERLRTLVIHVQDTGAGIANEDMPRLFTQFGKLHRTAAMNHNGIGLGLSIVKQIVKQSEGNISVHSDGPGLGSLFCFSMKMDYYQDENEEYRDCLLVNNRLTEEAKKVI